MRNDKMIYRAFVTSVIVLMLAGCSDDIELGETRVLNLVPYVSSYDGQKENANSRALTPPTGYEAFTTAYPTSAATQGRIKIFLAHQDNSSNWTCNPGGEFTYSNNGNWQSTVNVEPSKQYYVYGYMPAGSASATITSSDYSTGAELTLSGLNVLNPVDVCAIVGVKKSTEPGDLVAGQYGYPTDESSTDDQLYLLLEHIYSKVDFQFAVDADYNALRTIKLKSVKMELPSGTTASMTATVKFFNRSEQPMTCTFANGGGTSASQVTLLSTETELETTYKPVPGYFLPGSNNLSFNLISTYDVYDKKGNCVRANCSATNKITITAAQAGTNYKIKLLVKPTYLYQLSEPDLDNPVIKLAES